VDSNGNLITEVLVLCVTVLKSFDPCSNAIYIRTTMSKHPDQNGSQQAFDILEEQIKALIETCSYLKEENRLLRSQQERLQEERAALMEKNQTARSRVGAIITRLKSLEANT